MVDDIRQYARMALEAELGRLNEARDKVLALLAELDGTPSKGPRASAASEAGAPPARKRRKMSAEGRQRIREAVKRRWARVRAEKASATQDVEPIKRRKRTLTIPRGNRKR